jgi:hypothetical protein
MKMPRLGGGSLAMVPVAVLIAALLGYLNLHNDEVQIPLLILLLWDA